MIPRRKRLTTDGHRLPGVELRLDDDGEILSRGPDCCIGYTDAALTASAFDATLVPDRRHRGARLPTAT